jgi:hypothetical protein
MVVAAAGQACGRIVAIDDSSATTPSDGNAGPRQALSIAAKVMTRIRMMNE